LLGSTDQFEGTVLYFVVFTSNIESFILVVSICVLVKVTVELLSVKLPFKVVKGPFVEDDVTFVIITDVDVKFTLIDEFHSKSVLFSAVL
jgi:hypothetical protein